MASAKQHLFPDHARPGLWNHNAVPARVSRKMKRFASGRLARPLRRVSSLLINPKKAEPMSSHTWSMTLTVRTGRSTVTSMRDYLRQRGIVVPMRDRDVIAKYLHRIVENGNARTGIEAPAAITRPTWVNSAAREGLEGNALRSNAIHTGQPSRLALAVEGFAGLMVLACIALATARAFTHTPPSVPWYTIGHATPFSSSQRLPD